MLDPESIRVTGEGCSLSLASGLVERGAPNADWTLRSCSSAGDISSAGLISPVRGECDSREAGNLKLPSESFLLDDWLGVPEGGVLCFDVRRPGRVGKEVSVWDLFKDGGEGDDENGEGCNDLEPEPWKVSVAPMEIEKMYP